RWARFPFHGNSEFYADFGVYDVHLTVPDHFALGASGCLVGEQRNTDGTVTRHYRAEDVIDFAWSVYPRFQVHEDRWRQVQIRLLSPPEHSAMVPRYLHALKFAFEYMDSHIGPYPYSTLTVVDPPFHGLHSGLMEYPTLITVGTFAGMPSGIRTSESLIVHEFVHQYFMGMVASNEKEEPWLDEGFVTYFEDRIIDAAYGEKQSLIQFMGYRMDNRELTRTEYTAMRNPREGTIARPGWEFSENNYKGLVYSKTATALRTVEALIGPGKMDSVLSAYFHAWRFRHPRGEDFMACLRRGLTTLPDTAFAGHVYRLFEQSVYQALVLDYSVTRISNESLPARQGYFGGTPAEFQYADGRLGTRPTRSEVQVERNGDWVFPVTLLVVFEDGSSDTLRWSGEEGEKVFVFENRPPVRWATVDPQRHLFLDVDINNNSLTLQPDSRPLWKYSAKALFWIQNALQTLSFLT
ncbi:MAG TPA: M1 family aminopeptidase, partial [Saprospiraceae bacterium]|nr:M1 family aminopeptidase [Saprospiraceae bacterium]